MLQEEGKALYRPVLKITTGKVGQSHEGAFVLKML